MTDSVEAHYCGSGDLAATIADKLRGVGRDPQALAPMDLATVDEFHIRAV